MENLQDQDAAVQEQPQEPENARPQYSVRTNPNGSPVSTFPGARLLEEEPGRPSECSRERAPAKTRPMPKQMPGQSMFSSRPQQPSRNCYGPPNNPSQQYRSTRIFTFPNGMHYILHVPVNNDDYTVLYGVQATWSLHNLPNILYVVRPGPEHAKSAKPILKTSYLIFGKQVNDFPILPIQISSQVEGWRLETWLRLDRRITAQDIIDRVQPRYRSEITSGRIELRRSEFRELFHVTSWGSASSYTKITREMKQAGLDPKSNSTRGLTPGIINPALGEAGGRVALPHNIGSQIGPYALIGAQVYRSGPNTWSYVQPTYNMLVGNTQRTQATSSSSSSRKPVTPPGRDPFSDIHRENSTSPKKRKLSIEHGLPKPPPADKSELAYHGGPPARRFRSEPDGADRTTTLEDYLCTRQISFQDYLRLRYNDTPAAAAASLGSGSGFASGGLLSPWTAGSKME